MKEPRSRCCRLTDREEGGGRRRQGARGGTKEGKKEERNERREVKKERLTDPSALAIHTAIRVWRHEKERRRGKETSARRWNVGA